MIDGTSAWRVEVNRQRAQLLNAMSAVSESKYSAGWMRGIDQELYDTAGIWEIIGRSIGWPLGYRGDGGWVSWTQARNHYRKEVGNATKA